MPDDNHAAMKKVTLKVVKNRFGPNGGRAELMFHGACGYFAETDAEAERLARIAATRARIKADVARYLDENPDAPTREIREKVTGKDEVIGEIVREIRESRGTA